MIKNLQRPTASLLRAAGPSTSSAGGSSSSTSRTHLARAAARLSPAAPVVRQRTAAFSNSALLSDAPPSSSSSSPSTSAGASATGGESTSGEAQQPRQGLLRSLLHGSEAARAEGMLTSHSTQVARGKYIHELVTHRVRPSHVQQYLQLINDYYPRLSGSAAHTPSVKEQFHTQLLASWRHHVGALDTFTHIWQYDGYAGYDRARLALADSPLHAELEGKLAECLLSRDNALGQEFAFWPTAKKVNKEKTPAGGVERTQQQKEQDWLFELRTYQLKPGMLLEWETHW